MDPVLYAAAKAAALRICASVAAAEVPVDDALAETFDRLSAAPLDNNEELRALLVVFQALGELTAIGRLLPATLSRADDAKLAIPAGLDG